MKNVSLDKIYDVLLELNPPVKKIGVDIGEGIKLLDVNDILYITPESKRICYFTKQEKAYYNYDSLKNVEDKLKDNKNIVRVHRSYMANLDHIVKITKDGSKTMLVLKADVKEISIPMSDSYKKDIEAYLGL